MPLIKKTKFKTGTPRYCQNCGQESHHLTEVTKKSQSIQQLQYCQKCAVKYQGQQASMAK